MDITDEIAHLKELKDEKYFCDTCTETLKGKVLIWFSSSIADVTLPNCRLCARSFALDNINIVSYEKPNNLFMAGGSVLLCLHDLYPALCALTSKEWPIHFPIEIKSVDVVLRA